MQAQKKIKQTDAIFAKLGELHAEAQGADNVLRLSLDTKATVKIGLQNLAYNIRRLVILERAAAA